MTADLYDDPIVALAQRNDHKGSMLDFDCQATARNSLCGDQVTIEIKLEGQRISAINHQVRGCILCKAASEHLASLVEGYNIDEVKELRQFFEKALISAEDPIFTLPLSHQIFSPARSHKSRHSCLLLPYDALIEAFENG